MAVFLINSCKFRGCSLNFPTLGELIQHIEEFHIEIDPKFIEKQESEPPQAVALSHVLRFFAEGGAARKPLIIPGSNKKNRQRSNSVMSSSASIRSLTPTSSEYDFEEDEPMNSFGGGLDSDEGQESSSAEHEFSSHLIMSMMNNKNPDMDKPYCCPVKGCKKRYKNINGVKYHARNGHKGEARTNKLQKCFCGKAYHSVKQLEQHSSEDHVLTSGSVRNIILTSGSESHQPLSIIHPITISGGVLLTPTRTPVKSVSNVGDVVVATSQKTSAPQIKDNHGQEQHEINETVARALAAAKQAIAAQSGHS